MSHTRIWEVAPHLCGLPSEAARRRLLLVLKVFVDESGKGDEPVFVMAGYIARAEQWATFNDEWRAALDEEPRIDAFHMTEAMWNGEVRRLPKLLPIIGRNVLAGVTVTVAHKDYQSVFRGRVGKRLDRPYFFMYHSIIVSCLQWQIANGFNEPMDFIFDEQNEESDHLQSIFSEVRDMLPDEFRSRVGNRPIHVSDHDYPPLQAADILAWSLRRVYHRIDSRESPDEFLKDVFETVPIEKIYWTKQKLDDLYRGAKEINASDKRMFQYEGEAIARRLDMIISELNQKRLADAKEGETIDLVSIRAKGMKRFRLVHSCPLSSNPHLHRKASDECLSHE